MKKAIIAGLLVVLFVVMAMLVGVDPEIVLLCMIAYWVFLDRLESGDDNED